MRELGEVRPDPEAQAALHAVLALSTERLPLADLLARTLDRLFAVPWLGLEAQGCVFLVAQDAERLELYAHRNLPAALRGACAVVPFGTCLCGRAAATRRTVFAACVDDRHTTRYAGMPPHGHYCVPLLTEGRLVGVLNLYVKAGHVRGAEEERFLAAVADSLAAVVVRRRAEEALRRSEERFELAIRGTDAGIWDWDLTTNHVYFSPRWKSMLGYEETEISNDFDEWERRVHPEDLSGAVAHLRSYLRGETGEYEIEHRMRHKDGSWRWILSRGAAVRDDAGRATRMVGSHLDVTSRHAAEAYVRETELQLQAAERIQQRLLPSGPPDIEGYDLAGFLKPAAFAAGDDFDYLRLPGGRLGLVVGDVSGHGLGPALLMASTQTLMRVLSQMESDPGALLVRANDFLHAETSAAQFVSMLLVELDPPARRIRFANAGHPPGYLLHKDGSLKQRLTAGGPALSIFPRADYVTSPSVALDPGDLVLLVTDGALEARDRAGTFFGEERLLDTVRSALDRPASEITRRLYAQICRFTRRPHLEDDITLVVMKTAV